MPLIDIYDAKTGDLLITGVDVAIAPRPGYDITVPFQLDSTQVMQDLELYGVVKKIALTHDGVWHAYMHKIKTRWVPRQRKTTEEE